MADYDSTYIHQLASSILGTNKRPTQDNISGQAHINSYAVTSSQP